MDHFKNEIHDTLTGELTRMASAIDTKVEIREVQQALNECQGDIRHQLKEFRETVNSEQKQTEADLRKIVDRKANVSDMHDALTLKADARDTPSRQEFLEGAVYKLE